MLLLAVWGVVLFGLSPVFARGSWYVSAFSIVAAMLAAGLLLRGFERPRVSLRSTLAGVFAGFVAWIVSLSIRGRIGAWWSDPAGEAMEVWNRIEMGIAPLKVEGALEDALLFAVLLVSAVAAYFFLRGWLLGSGIVVALLSLMPVAVTGVRLPLELLLVSGVLIALLVWVGSPRPKPVGLVSAGLSLVIVAGVLQIAPDGRDRVWNDAVLFGPVSVTVPDVTVALAEDLRERSNTVAFHASGLQPGSHRFTLATLADFEDGTWLPQFELNDAGHSVDVVRMPWGLEPVVDPSGEFQIPLNATITIGGLRSAWLPISGGTSRIQGTDEFEAEEWVWVERSQTARSEASVTQDGDKYYLAALPTLPPEVFSFASEELTARHVAGNGSTLYASDESIPAEIEPYLVLPNGMPDEMRETAQTVAGGSDNAIGAALLLQEYFTGGQFAYDESAPYDPGADPGDPYSVMSALLEQRSGFCVHYASTFAVMARELGIPTRLSVGYAANVGANASGAKVRGTDLHAWPEIFVEGMGWMAFEPTPGGAGGPDSLDAAVEPQTASPGQSRPVVTPPMEVDALTGQLIDKPGEARSRGSDGAPWGIGATIGLLGGGLLLLLAAPGAVRLVRSKTRSHRVARGVRPAQQAWAEVIDTAVDLGLLTRETPLRARTPGALVEYLAGVGGLGAHSGHGGLDREGAEALRMLAGWMEAERFSSHALAHEALAHEDASHASSDIAGCLATVLRELRAQATRRQRVASLLMPRSVLHRNPM